MLSAKNGEIFDAIVIPGGGEGSKKISDTAEIIQLMRDHCKRATNDNVVVLAAMCAAPAFTLTPHGFLNGNIPATCYPR